jgi:hypothetical protein
LDLSKVKNPESTQKFLGKLVKDFTPITDSDLLIPGVQQFFELKANKSFFKDKAIVPEYIKIKNKWFKSDEIDPEYQTLNSTSAVAKTIGEALGWSPIQVDYVIKQGVINDIIRVLDLPIKGFSGDSGFEKASELPLLRTLIGTSSYGQSITEKEKAQKEMIEKNRKKIEAILK